MIVVKAKLPDPDLFQIKEGTDTYPLCWRSRDTDRLLIRARGDFNWNKVQIISIKEAKGRRDEIVRIDLVITPEKAEFATKAKINYRTIYGIPFSTEPTLRFYGIGTGGSKAIALSVV